MHFKEMSRKTIESDGSSITLPDACILMGKSAGCKQIGSVGVLVSLFFFFHFDVKSSNYGKC